MFSSSFMMDITCIYDASYCNSSSSLVELNDKSASGLFPYDRSKAIAEVYTSSTECIDNQTTA